MFDHFAVIGNPISHSLSPLIHQLFARQFSISLVYEKILGLEETFEQQVIEFMRQGGKGLNVTLPFKQNAFALAQHHTSRCLHAKAANTLWMKNNQFYADNTDGIGLLRDIGRYTVLKDKKILILGAGGAARGIINPMMAAKPQILIITSRTTDRLLAFQRDFPHVKCEALDKLSQPFDVVINATSASLSGSFLSLPVNCLTKDTFCYDLAYNQTEDTPFIQYAQSQGCDAIDGLGMLVEQAAEAFFIWNNKMPETESVLRGLRKP